MPNGGSDCFGTCWFNVKNKGEAGYGHAKDPEPDFWAIRDIVIEEDPSAANVRILRAWSVFSVGNL